MRILSKIVLISFIFIETLSSFEIDPYPEKATLTEIFSINCLQMTQSQQMLKAYVMVGVKSNFQNPQEHLTKAIVAYDKRMYKVRKYFYKQLKKKSHQSGKIAFDKALELWKINKKLLEAEPSKENVLVIQKNFLEMINQLLAGTQPIATPELELISLTGKLCRKPMEVTIDYLIRMWGVDVEDYEKNIESTIGKYHVNLKTLSANKLNNDESQELLKKAKNEFKFFEFMYKSKTKFIPSLLSKKADDNFLIIRSIKMIYKDQAS